MQNNFSRRKFLQTTALAGAALAVQPRLFGSEIFKKTPDPGLQLWSVREDVGKDAAGTLKALSGMGYKKVEGFGLNEGKIFGMATKDFSKLLKDSGLNMQSTHCSFLLKDYDEAKKSLSDHAKKNIDDAAAMGLKYIINPWMDDKERPEIAKLAKVFDAAGAYAKKAGIRFGYHNHNFEFEQKAADGRLLIEWLLHETDPKNVDFEMDIYWVEFAKNNPIDWFKRYPGRWKLCHAKDMAKTPERQSVEVGDGSIDFNTIFKQHKLAGLQYYIIELEAYKTTPMEGAKRSREGFMKLKF